MHGRKNIKLLNERFLIPVKPFTTAKGPLKGCDSPQSDMSVRVLSSKIENAH